MKEVKEVKEVKVTKSEIDLILKLDSVYFFDLFKKLQIAKNDEEEYKLRDALATLAKKLK